MVMIVKDPEKKARGFISVTWITVRAHVSALPGPDGGVATVSAGGPRDVGAGPRMPLLPFRWPQWWEDADSSSRRPTMRDNDARAVPGHRGGTACLALAPADLPSTR